MSHKVSVRQILQAALQKEDISIFDLHCHILSRDVAEKHPSRYYNEGCYNKKIDGFVQTEHNQPPETCQRYPDFVVPGVEITTQEGHVNVLGLPLDDIDSLLEKYKKELSRKKLKLERLLFDLHEKYNGNGPLIVYPHPFQYGGIFHGRKKLSYPSYDLPSAFKDRFYCLEWTNSRRSPGSKTANKVLSTVRDPQRNLVLVAGSDAHSSHELGMAGIIVKKTNCGFDQVKDAVRAREHEVYHVRIEGSGGVLFISNAHARKIRNYKLSYNQQKEEWDLEKRLKLSA